MLNISTGNEDSLVQALRSLIETTDNYIIGLSNHSSSTLDILTLIVAGIAVIASFYSVYVTKKSHKENLASNENIANEVQAAEDRRTKSLIDANLTANARIEWIQNIRQSTAELISLSYKYINSKDDEK